MRIRNLLHVAMIAGVGVLVSPRGAISQGGDGPQQGAVAGDPLPALATEWQQSFDAARQTNNSEALSLLSRAKTLLNQAETFRRRGETARAAANADAARLLIHRANQILRTPAGRSPQIDATLRDAETLMQNAVAQGAPPDQTAQVRLLLDQARKAQTEGRHDAAVRLSATAQTQARQLWQRAVASRQLRQRCRVLESAAEPMVRRARTIADANGGDAVKSAAERAQQFLQMAQSTDEATQPAAKARLLERAMQNAEAVLKTLDAATYSTHLASRSIADADAALARADEVASGDAAGNDVSAELRRGRLVIANARQELASGNSIRARTLAEEARQIAEQVLRNALGEVTEASVRAALQQTDLLIERASAASGNQTDPLLVEARNRQEDARRMLADGDFRRALAQTRIAARLAQRINGR